MTANYPSPNLQAGAVNDEEAAVLTEVHLLFKMHDLVGWDAYYSPRYNPRKTMFKSFVLSPFVQSYPTRRYLTAQSLLKAVKRMITKIQVREYDRR